MQLAQVEPPVVGMSTMPHPPTRRQSFWFWTSALAFVLSACQDSDNANRGQAIVTYGEYGPQPSALLFPQGSESSTGGGSGFEPSSGSYDEPYEPTIVDPSYFPTEIEVDPPRDWSLFCGDGAFDPRLEECDAGAIAQDDQKSVCTANCQTRDVLVGDPSVSGRQANRRLGFGRHSLAANELSGALVWVEQGKAESLITRPTDAEQLTEAGTLPQIIVQTLDAMGNLEQRLVLADSQWGDHPILASNPVVAAQPDGTLVVAYNDLNGDGSELGVALRTLQKQDDIWVVGPTTYANTSTLGAQFNADLVWTDEGLLSAWVDFSDSYGPRIVTRNLSVGGPEIVLAEPGPALGGVSLTALPQTLRAITGEPTGRTWAAAYRQGEGEGAETIVVYSGGVGAEIRPALFNGIPADFSEGDPGPGGAANSPTMERLMPGHMEDRPGVAPLTGDRVVVAFTVGSDPNNTGVATVFRLWVAVVDIENTLVESIAAIEPNLTLTVGVDGDKKRSMREPSLVSAGVDGQVYLAWRSEGRLGAADGEDLWLKRLDWNSEAGTLDLSLPEVPLQRNEGHTQGDQRRPTLAAMMVPGGGDLRAPALGIAWEDWGVQYDAEQARPDILLQVAPNPIRRDPPVEKDCGSAPCGVGEGPCASDAECTGSNVCFPGRGPWYGLGKTTPVCQPPTCGAEGCGDECGVCFNCPDRTTYLGTANFCSYVCPCDTREGDCDNTYECDKGLSCIENTGDLVGYPAAIDLCDYDHCHNGIYEPGAGLEESRQDCGGPDCYPCENGSTTHCLDVDCTIGEGDCTPEGAACAADLVCNTADSELYGLQAGVGVCVEISCPADRTAPDAPDFCDVDCKCPAGYGECGSDDECVNSQCIQDSGIYFGRASDVDMCMADHCFDGVKNFGETQVDCGGSCGTECSVCEADPTFRSLDDVTQWGQINYWEVGISPTSAVAAHSNATNGSKSLAYVGCGFMSLGSEVFDGTQFEVVGDKLYVDIQFRVGEGGNSWDWLGGFGLQVWVEGGDLFTLTQDIVRSRSEGNSWDTLVMHVPAAVQEALLAGDKKLQWRFGGNRNCGVVGASEGAILIDNFRFGGDAVFRSECAPDTGSGSGGTNGSGGAPSSGGATGAGGSASSGGSTATGGAGGSASGGNSGTGGSGGAGAGGSTATGGDSGAGGSGGGANGNTGGSAGSGGTDSAGPAGITGDAAPLFGFEDASKWSAGGTFSAEATQGLQSMSLSTASAAIQSVPFGANDVSPSALLLMDLKLPAPRAGGALGGSLQLLLNCPSRGVYSQYLVQYWNKTSGEWFTVSKPVVHSVVSTMNSGATDCYLKLTHSFWGADSGEAVLIDNIRFEQPQHCNQYSQQNTPPFSQGMASIPVGTPAAPYPLCTVAQLQHVVDTPTLWSSNYVLMDNLDLSSLSGQIGEETRPFTGTFDGAGNSLSNYSLVGVDNVGLFGAVSGDGVLDGQTDGRITNLVANNFNVSGTNNVGALLGSSVSGFTDAIEVVGGTVTGAGRGVGGLIGFNQGTVSNCTSTAALSVTDASSVGGLIGDNAGRVEESSCHGTIQVSGSTSERIGGLIGSLSSSQDIINCAATTSIVGTGKRVGGAIGAGGYSKIIRVSARGDVEGSGQVGGLLGWGLEVEIADSYAQGNATATESTVGGLAGEMSAGSVTNAYSLGSARVSDTGEAGTAGAFLGAQTAGTTLVLNACFANSVANVGLNALASDASASGVSLVTASELNTQSTYDDAGWDFVSVWTQGDAGAELR